MRGRRMKLRDTPSVSPALWRALPCPAAELRLELVLPSGQTFRWRESSPGAWTGVLGDTVWTLRQERDRLWYTVYGGEAGADTDRLLREYFQLDVGLRDLYRSWGAADPLFREAAKDFPERLCRAFGRHLCHLDAQPFHAFPSLAALAGLVSPHRCPHGLMASTPHVPQCPHQAMMLRPGCGRWALATEPSSSAALLAPSPRGSASRGCTSSAPHPTPRPGRCCAPYPVWAPRRRRCRWIPTCGASHGSAMAWSWAAAASPHGHTRRSVRAAPEPHVCHPRHGDDAPGAHPLSTGDFFRGLWGPRAGWAQAVLFCADLHKGREPVVSQDRDKES
ncbi:N-glycosylase/DNA lyase isoform X2 [Melopsittacus undulatus]|uniref:N-glycosylase/DNA lyase isoform X2 n=1 Tax=Melopsittacus undulatus TaxID=13146 RepID=UPI00146D2FC1|nr:N-glycosylase/DNA lyase isoform X2 [Melopsittacus undulatus]